MDEEYVKSAIITLSFCLSLTMSSSDPRVSEVVVRGWQWETEMKGERKEAHVSHTVSFVVFHSFPLRTTLIPSETAHGSPTGVVRVRVTSGNDRNIGLVSGLWPTILSRFPAPRWDSVGKMLMAKERNMLEIFNLNPFFVCLRGRIRLWTTDERTVKYRVWAWFGT